MRVDIFDNKALRYLFAVLFMVFSTQVSPGAEEEMVEGAVILVQKTAPVVFLDAQNQKLDDESMQEGSLVPLDHWVQAGEGGRALLLLSNGTLLTVDENSKIKVTSFEQVPLDAKWKNLGSVEEEPSSSNILIDIDVGSLVFKTKKLKKKSNFQISTPLGTAGIRGTQGDVSFSATGGMQVDVTESMVEVTLRNGAATFQVSAGKGLSVPPSLQAVPGPINPANEQRINGLNANLSAKTKNYMYSDIKKAASRNRSNARSPRRRAPRNSDSPNRAPTPAVPSNQNQPQAPAAPAAPMGDPQGFFNNPNLQPAPVTESRIFEELKENTSSVQGMQYQLQRFGLNPEQERRFWQLPRRSQSILLQSSIPITRRLLSLESIDAPKIDSYLKYSPQSQSIAYELSNKALSNLLEQQIEEGFVTGLIGKGQNAGARSDDFLPGSAPVYEDERAKSLAVRLSESPHSHILNELMNSSGGELTDESLRMAEVADHLLRDYRLGANNTYGLVSLDSSEVWINPFYQEISSLYATLENDQSVSGSPMVLGGANLIVEANSRALAPYFAGAAGRPVVLSALGDLTFEGDFSWASKPEDAARLVVMSAGETKFAEGMTLKSATGDLVLSSRSDLSLNDVGLEVSREAVIRGMRDVSLINSRIGADSMATVKAARNLNVDGLTFSRSVSSILMEATTIRLSNVNFPAASAVRLNSLHGAIDGKYPNFGTAVPAAAQIGRVNFLKNVSSGGNQIMTRQAFDQYGKNVIIGKTPRP
ncbi:MAG: hypothetical protein HN531_11725 [Opitutae bacterium]|jgi:hypothetical protein|nr:hypothetical protein [Opitutae bacterium]